MPIFPSFFVNKTGGYEIEQSLRFNSADSAYLNRTPGSAGNRKTWTWSGWAKRGKLNVLMSFLGVNALSCGDLVTRLQFNSSNQLVFDDFVACGSTHINLITTQVFRDPSAWIHIVVAVDTTQGTAANRAKLYVNGSQVTAFATETYPTQNQDTAWNSTLEQRIGRDGDPNYLDGYLAEVNFIDGSALDHEDFGEFDDNGVWRPIAYTGSYGTNGFYLKFDPSATNGIGHDHSGNGNNFTPTGFTTSGTGTDVMSDTPTTNWCTLNPLSLRASYNNDCNDGNLGIEAVGGNWDRGTKGTIGASSGKWYWEYTHGTIASGYPQADIGVTKYASEINHYNNGGSGSSDTYLIQGNNGNKYTNGSGSSYGSSFTTGDTCNIALDLDNGKVWFGKNGTWFNSGDPAAGTNEAFSGLSGTFWPLFYWGISAGTSGINQAYFNFGQRAFEYTVPTGFLPLNTSNLPAPDIKDGSKNFNTLLWNGDGVSGRAITGVGFQPDFLWIKRKNASVSHYLQNSVTGATNYMFSDDTVQERNLDDSVDSFDTDGFTLGNDGGTNASGGTYVGWNWLAGNGTSSIAAGSIDATNPTIASTVSVNATAGFSIVSYTGTGANATVGHGLGVPPQFFFGRNRDDTGGLLDWIVYHESIGNTGRLKLNTTGSTSTSSTFFQNTSPSSTVITIGTSNDINKLNDDYIMYCFAEVEGYSKFGSYTGNGNANGPFVFCGFKPRWIMLKKSNTSTIYTSWSIYDTARDSYNVSDAPLYANVADQEGTNSQGTVESGHNVDILSNGFKLRDSNQIRNTSGDTYIFAAFAENPFGGSGVSPATAR